MISLCALFIIAFLGTSLIIAENETLTATLYSEDVISSNNNSNQTIVGASCGTVTPGYQNECCVRKGYQRWDREEWDCTNEPESDDDAIVCTTEYAPVCGLVQIQCIRAPCNPIYQTFSNRCELSKNHLAKFVYEGECEEEETERCTETGGEWKTFPNGCADTCQYVRNPAATSCIQATTKSCDCGPDKCWTGEKCQLNEMEDEEPIACTMDAQMCPDGTYVGRSGPNCEFRCPKPYNISENKVCCKVYGYGAQMVEVNVRYKITDKKECTIPEGFVGGNREIVNKSYCIEQIKEDRQEFLENKEKIIRERNKIKHNYTNNSECPESCICSGSTLKCEFENGTRVMTVVAGNSGNVIVQVKNINASTNVTLYKADGKVYGVFKNNETHEIILPDEARERIKEREQNKEGRRINWTNENITLNEEGFYEIQGKKKARLLWIVPVKEKFQSHVDAETGEVVHVRKAWWGFLARDVKEE